MSAAGAGPPSMLWTTKPSIGKAATSKIAASPLGPQVHHPPLYLPPRIELAAFSTFPPPRICTLDYPSPVGLGIEDAGLPLQKTLIYLTRNELFNVGKPPAIWTAWGLDGVMVGSLPLPLSLYPPAEREAARIAFRDLATDVLNAPTHFKVGVLASMICAGVYTSGASQRQIAYNVVILAQHVGLDGGPHGYSEIAQLMVEVRSGLREREDCRLFQKYLDYVEGTIEGYDLL
ncbi:hypothetical protein JCM10213v2_008029 [Rhodosporidiobolus nylandii]